MMQMARMLVPAFLRKMRARSRVERRAVRRLGRL
jgi:hypothetical protein